MSKNTKRSININYASPSAAQIALRGLSTRQKIAVGVVTEPFLLAQTRQHRAIRAFQQAQTGAESGLRCGV